jgi:ABC-type glycerol-3-phosphate transport system permease component
VTVLVASWAGFAIARAKGATRARLILFSVIAVMVPISALWVPRFVMFRWLGLVDTLVPLMAPAVMATTPFFVLVFAVVYARIPKELYEAAVLEGMSPLAIWRSVAWPLGRPAAFAIAVLAFVFHWSNFVDPLLYLSTESSFTVPLGLRALQTLEPTNHPILMAASVIAAAPAVIAFLAAQRAFFTKTLGMT